MERAASNRRKQKAESIFTMAYLPSLNSIDVKLKYFTVLQITSKRNLPGEFPAVSTDFYKIS